MLAKCALGISVALLDLAVIFVSWTLHPGNVAVPEAAMLGATSLFELAMFPVGPILPAAIVNRFFWTAIVCNSLLWGAAAICLYAVDVRATNRKRSS